MGEKRYILTLNPIFSVNVVFSFRIVHNFSYKNVNGNISCKQVIS